jgi:hypothetical protein
VTMSPIYNMILYIGGSDAACRIDPSIFDATSAMLPRAPSVVVPPPVFRPD